MDAHSEAKAPEVDGRRRSFGSGMLKGLATTAKAFVTPTHTAEYPDVKPSLPSRSRGVIALVEENCTVCMLCSRECPDWCIYIDSHKETLPAVEGGRARQRNVLDRFAIDFSLCMYCGICVEVCPFDALFWASEFEYAEFDIHDLIHERERLSGWMASVPPPPAPDAAAPEPKEVAGAQRAAAKAAAPPRRAAAGAGASAAERPARVAGDRPARAAGDRPARAAGDRPARAAGERPARAAGERPARASGDRPARPPRAEPAAPAATPPAAEPTPAAAAEPTPAAAAEPTAPPATPAAPPPAAPPATEPTAEEPKPQGTES